MLSIGDARIGVGTTSGKADTDMRAEADSDGPSEGEGGEGGDDMAPACAGCSGCGCECAGGGGGSVAAAVCRSAFPSAASSAVQSINCFGVLSKPDWSLSTDIILRPARIIVFSGFRLESCRHVRLHT